MYIYIYIHVYTHYMYTHVYIAYASPRGHTELRSDPIRCTPNLPPKIIPTKISRLIISGKVPIDMRIPPLIITILLESSPLKSRISVQRLDVFAAHVQTAAVLYEDSTHVVA